MKKDGTSGAFVIQREFILPRERMRTPLGIPLFSEHTGAGNAAQLHSGQAKDGGHMAHTDDVPVRTLNSALLSVTSARCARLQPSETILPVR